MDEMKELKPEYYFNLQHFPFTELFDQLQYVWQVLPRIKSFVKDLTNASELASAPPGVTFQGKNIVIGEGTVIEEGAYLAEPIFIGRNCVIRHGAYLRGNILVADNCVIGHATEVKNSVFFEGAKAPHFNYVGDCIIGSAVNLGAGTKLSNVKIFDAPVTVRFGEQTLKTGLRKFGAILGDRVQTGCNSVLNPGCVIGPDSMVYPNVTASGWHTRGSIIKPAHAPRTLHRST